MILVLNLKTKFLAFILLFLYPLTTIADPEINGELLPPGEAIYVTDPAVLQKIDLGPHDEPVWCYSNLANSLIISSADREKEKCELRLSQQKRQLEAVHSLQINTLKIQLESTTNEYQDILRIKNIEIEELTAASLKRPNDYSLWWATGGFVTGIVTVLSILWATK